MAAFRFPPASATPVSALAVALVAVALVACAAQVASAGEPLRDAPIVWYEDDQRPLESRPVERDPSIAYDYADGAVFMPFGYYTDLVRNMRRLIPGKERDKDSPNVNRLGEVPNSTWFTNRIGLFSMTPEQVGRGPSIGHGPSKAGPWMIVGAKTEGVTPGFTIKDADGQRFLIKFGPKEYPVMPTAAGVISGRLLHAVGYFVPEDDIVHFRRDDLVLEAGVEFKPSEGPRRAMVESDIDAILERVEEMEGGRMRAISSKFLPGRPIGPFDYLDHRSDDANDRVGHHHRRELRGLKVFAEWVNHFDVKQQNSLDILIEDDDRRYVRHYLIDFASTLGTGANGPIQKWGWEATVDPKALLRRTLNLGLLEDDYRQIERPAGLTEIGWFETEHFTARGFEPPVTNPAMARINVRDGYWAAKIITAFTDQQLRAAVEAGQYRDPRAIDAMVRILAGRRDKIGRAWFDIVTPLDFFVHDSGTVRYRDLGLERGIYPGAEPRYRSRVSAVDADRRASSEAEWIESATTTVRLDTSAVHDARIATHPFVQVEVQVNREGRWGRSVHCYVARRSGRVIEVRRGAR